MFVGWISDDDGNWFVFLLQAEIKILLVADKFEEIELFSSKMNGSLFVAQRN